MIVYKEMAILVAEWQIFLKNKLFHVRIAMTSP